MIPVVCRVSHDPENGKYGDCVRACIASIMELDAEAVPHFFEDGCDGETGNRRVNEFLAWHGLIQFRSSIPESDADIDDIFAIMNEQNPDMHYMLFGRTHRGNHVVVCKGGSVAHDPAWSRSPLIGGGSNGHWTIVILARK